ncbi:hemerythrin domain-containing protein [Caulobacter segnis]|uniref:hemerythrin domain-containing protein n=1 Tax=Caulobacter segnis TaxID=88688 RepID=UPI00240EE395|nr:hemerythrin domain-containing protein [Caulobacter segnis]MDG2520371.1 hemerythrin domain-containing protein [Caulobacter segnis]
MSDRTTRRRWRGPLALGFALGLGLVHLRKLLAQGASAVAGPWDQVLAAEHKVVMSLLDRAMDTPPQARLRRKLLLAKIEWGLSKHAYAEETVIYPALRALGGAGEKSLFDDHAEIKILLASLRDRPADHPDWIEDARALKALLETHMAEEEATVFPRLRSALPEAQNLRLTTLLNAQSIRLA